MPTGEVATPGNATATPGAEAVATPNKTETPALSESQTPGTALGAESAPPAKPAEDEQGKPDKSVQEADIVLQFPDGVAVDEDLVKEFVPLAKKHGLKSEQAQEIANLYLKAVQKQGTATTDAWKNQQKEWADTNRKDPAIGGKDYETNVLIARQAISKFGGDALRREIDALGIGDNPALLKAFVAIGRATSEDKIRVTPPPALDSEVAVQRKLYPTMFNADGSPKK